MTNSTNDLHVKSIRILGGEGRTDDNWYDSSELLTLEAFNKKMRSQSLVVSNRQSGYDKTDIEMTMSDGKVFQLMDFVGESFINYDFISNRIAYQQRSLEVHAKSPEMAKQYYPSIEEINDIIAEWEQIREFHNRYPVNDIYYTINQFDITRLDCTADDLEARDDRLPAETESDYESMLRFAGWII